MEFRSFLIVANALAFLGYGAHCLNSESMRLEFERYGVAQLRVLTGGLELLAGVGLLVGLRWPLALQVSSGGLALLMLGALGARFRVGDNVWLWAPATALMLLNVYLCASSLRGSN